MPGQGVEAPHPCPPTEPEASLSSVPLIISFYNNKLENSTQTVFLNSVSHPRKLIKLKEGLLRTSLLQPSGRSPGDNQDLAADT